MGTAARLAVDVKMCLRCCLREPPMQPVYVHASAAARTANTADMLNEGAKVLQGGPRA